MRVKIEYISKITINKISAPVYITDTDNVYIGLEIMPYIEDKHQIKQHVITDIDDAQYNVYPLIEVCKLIKKGLIIALNTSNIQRKEHKEIPKEETPEFVLTLKNILKNKK